MKTTTEKKSCKTCENAIFNERWGEYKCKISQHRIYEPDDQKNCIDYKKGEPTPSARKDDDYDQV